MLAWHVQAAVPIHSTSVAEHASNSSIRVLETEGPSKLHSEFKISLAYVRSCLS